MALLKFMQMSLCRAGTYWSLPVRNLMMVRKPCRGLSLCCPSVCQSLFIYFQLKDDCFTYCLGFYHTQRESDIGIRMWKTTTFNWIDNWNIYIYISPQLCFKSSFQKWWSKFAQSNTNFSLFRCPLFDNNFPHDPFENFTTSFHNTWNHLPPHIFITTTTKKPSTYFQLYFFLSSSTRT